MRTVAFCECEPYARAVLAQHWPGVICYPDVRELTAAGLATDGIAVDVICGGFPCQDISVAGKNAGITGPRSGLWREFHRLIGELRPRFVIVENVAALLARGLEQVLGDLASIGYDAEWHCIPAAYVGAPHRRDRIWIVAYPTVDSARIPWSEQRWRDRAESGSEAMADISSGGQPADRRAPRQAGHADIGSADVAHSERARLEGHRSEPGEPQESESGNDGASGEVQHSQDDATNGEGIRRGVSAGDWRTEPDVGRVAHGVSSRVDRLTCLGNAVVPQIPEMIGRAIMELVRREAK